MGKFSDAFNKLKDNVSKDMDNYKIFSEYKKDKEVVYVYKQDGTTTLFGTFNYDKTEFVYYSIKDEELILGDILKTENINELFKITEIINDYKDIEITLKDKNDNNIINIKKLNLLKLSNQLKEVKVIKVIDKYYLVD